jgi:hypothetical protein
LMDQVKSKIEERRLSKNFEVVTWAMLLLIIVLNLYFYFGLEPKNAAAMRVMAYELRLIGLEIAQDDLPVILVGRDILDPINVEPQPGEKYPNSNPPLILPPAARRLAVINFSGRHDPSQTVSYNFANPKEIYFVERGFVETSNLTPHGPAKIIFKSLDRELGEFIQRNYPRASIKRIRNIYGESLLSVAIVSKNPAITAGSPAVN